MASGSDAPTKKKKKKGKEKKDAEAEVRGIEVLATNLTWEGFLGSLPFDGVMHPCAQVKIGEEEFMDSTLSLYENDDKGKHQIKMMLSIDHPFVLKGMVFNHFSDNGVNFLECYLEKVCGTFEDFVQKYPYYFFPPISEKNKKKKKKKKEDLIVVVFHKRLLTFLRNLIDAIWSIHHKGHYHGGVQAKNILYFGTDDEFVFKLHNFRLHRGSDLASQQANDWRNVSKIVKSIKDDYLKMILPMKGSRDYIHVALEDLYDILKKAKKGACANVKEEALTSMAFHSEITRQRYLTVVVPEYLKHNNRWQTYHYKLECELLILIDVKSWTAMFPEYLPKMNAHRMNGNSDDESDDNSEATKKPYNGNSGYDLVLFLSALYTHYLEESSGGWNLKQIDPVVRLRVPLLFRALMQIENEAFQLDY